MIDNKPVHTINGHSGPARRAKDLYLTYGKNVSIHIVTARVKAATNEQKMEQIKFWSAVLKLLQDITKS